MPLKIIQIMRALAIIIILLPACNPRSKDVGKQAAMVKPDSTAGIVMADTIIYEVIISSPNPDDPWAKKSLGRLNHDALIDSIFAMVYQKKAIAYNHETNEKLTPKQIRRIESEKGFSRKNIGMIQFTEAWYLNTEKNTMTKKVLSLVLGYNFYLAGNTELFGHKPVFRVEMN